MQDNKLPKNLAIRVTPASLKALAVAGRAAADDPFEGPGDSSLEAMVAPPSDDDARRLVSMRAGLDAAVMMAQGFVDSGQKLPFAMDHGPSSLLQSFLQEVADDNLSDFLERGILRGDSDDGLEAVFDERDAAGWATSLLSWWRKFLDKHPFVPLPARAEAMPKLKHVAILGDWGTGLYGAPVAAGTIQKAAKHELLLHLGDVYYSGRPKEVDERFLAMWPTVPGAVSRAVNSNHEMYAGGHGYFRKTLPSFRQASSCFVIETDRFVLVGLDTGYDENDLCQGQVEWLTQIVSSSKKEGRKVILFSHHAPFSSFETASTNVATKLAPLLTSKSIFAWYWGHEHRMVRYDRHPTWGLHGRLVGHSGFPYFRDNVSQLKKERANKDLSEWYRVPGKGVPDGLLLDGDNPYVLDDPPAYGPHGYMSLELDGRNIHEVIHAADGTPLWEETLAS